MLRATSRNSALRERAARVIPGGMYGHESTALLPAEFPQFFARGAGSRLWDADGNEYIDYMCAYGPNLFGYTTTKHGLTGLMRSLARDYSPQGVRVNAVCPGWVRTPMADQAMDLVGAMRGIGREGAYRLLTCNVPLGRPGEPDEVAAICAFLASPDASLITGAMLMADGGAHIVDVPTIPLDPRATSQS